VKNILLTSKQRAKLRGMANTMDAIIRIGKEGITEGVLKQIDEALTARELIKIALEKNCEIEPKEAIAYICEKLNAEPVQVIGRKIVIYRMSEENPRIQI
jgi:RNA-binding protein